MLPIEFFNSWDSDEDSEYGTSTINQCYWNN